jgi:hypothetical protein
MAFQFGQGKKPGFFSLLLIVLTVGLFFVFGIGLLMIAATLVVLMLPWLWWKKRKLIARMREAQAAYQAQQQDPSASGVIIEGEVVQTGRATPQGTEKIIYIETTRNELKD